MVGNAGFFVKVVRKGGMAGGIFQWYITTLMLEYWTQKTLLKVIFF